MHRKFVIAPVLLLAAAALWLAPLHPAWSGLLNGDFADPADLAGWTPTGSGVSEPTGDFAQMQTDGDDWQTLKQTFLLPATPTRLFFDFAFSTEATAPVNGFPDSFAVSLFTSDYEYYLDLLVVDVHGAVPDPSDGTETAVGALPIAVDLDSTITIAGFDLFAGGFSTSGRISLPLPVNVLGQEVTLYFDLYDKLDGANTRAAIDNVAVQLAAVPEPATLSLMLLGLAAAGVARRRSAS